MSISITEQLVHTTTRIETYYADGRFSRGTGFFFSFNFEDGKNIVVIATNKHVVKDGVRGRFRVTLTGSNGEPDFSTHIPIELDHFEERWIPHPNDDVDLCILPMGNIFSQTRAFFRHINENDIPSLDEFNELVAIEDITMIGYPNGLWDSANNMPIVRKGITATHPKLDYLGKSEFLIDAACFPGSSGSPVFLLNLGSYPMKNGGIAIGSRLKFLGVMRGGPQHRVAVPDDEPLSIPNNLGNVIKSSQMMEFKPILKKILEQQTDS